MLFYMGKVVSHMPLFSYLGAVSFLILQFKNYSNILYICVLNYYASKKVCGKTSECQEEWQIWYW